MSNNNRAHCATACACYCLMLYLSTAAHGATLLDQYGPGLGDGKLTAPAVELMSKHNFNSPGKVVPKDAKLCFITTVDGQPVRDITPPTFNVEGAMYIPTGPGREARYIVSVMPWSNDGTRLCALIGQHPNIGGSSTHELAYFRHRWPVFDIDVTKLSPWTITKLRNNALTMNTGATLPVNVELKADRTNSYDDVSALYSGQHTYTLTAKINHALTVTAHPTEIHAICTIGKPCDGFSPVDLTVTANWDGASATVTFATSPEYANYISVNGADLPGAIPIKTSEKGESKTAITIRLKNLNSLGQLRIPLTVNVTLP